MTDDPDMNDLSHPLDVDACDTRNRLVAEGRLAWTGRVGEDRRLVPSTPPETSAERSRRLRREQEAA